MVAASTTATILTAAISAGAGLLGVIIGSAATTLRERMQGREEAERALNAAALRCLARLHKIQAADAGTYDNAAKDRGREINNLGSDVDDYVVAIANMHDRTTRARHWKIYCLAEPILIGQRTDELERLVAELEKVRHDLMATSVNG